MSSAITGRAPRLTPEQYLALERKARQRNEFRDGFIEAMAGASREHNLIAGNVFGELRDRFKARRCEVYMNDMRVWVGAGRLYTYPDVVALCGEPKFQDGEADTLTNPAVIVEILSPSTEAYDRGRKFADYRRLESLREYVVVEQEIVLIERFSRHGSDWLLTVYGSLDETLRLESIDCAIPLKEIYGRVHPREQVGRES